MRLSTTIISVHEVNKRLGEPGWVILDCRFDLARPQWGYEAYQQNHIPGALFADMNKDLAGPVNDQSGRHPLPDPEDFIRKAGEWGIDPLKQVVVYDQSHSGYAARLWWLLRAYGHESVAVLDGGLQAWNEAGYSLRSGIEKSRQTDFEGFPDPNQWVTTREVEALLNDESFVMIDTRSPDRFRGENETVDTVAGHIPGTVNRYYRENLTSDDFFLRKDQLQQAIDELIGEIPADHVIVYCGSGVTACHQLLAMEIAGLYGAKLYAGSWSEWIRDPKRPVETGP